MSARRTVALVLVVRNEEKGLETILDRIDFSKFNEVLAIDGHSTDSSRSILLKAGVRTYLQRYPGLGAAMLEAREYVKSDALIFFHPDGNECPEDLPKAVELLQMGNEFVVASRMIKGSWNEENNRIFKWRKWTNQTFAILANLFFAKKGNRTTDVTNGFRGVSCLTFDKMKLTSKDLTMDFQMVIHALKLMIPITEFPTKEGLRIDGKTNFPSFYTGIAELRLLFHEIKKGPNNV